MSRSNMSDETLPVPVVLVTSVQSAHSLRLSVGNIVVKQLLEEVSATVVLSQGTWTLLGFATKFTPKFSLQVSVVHLRVVGGICHGVIVGLKLVHGVEGQVVQQ